MNDQSNTLPGIVHLEEWQRIQDSFSEVLEVSLCTVSPEGKPLTKTSRPSRLCSEVLAGNPHSVDFCGDCILRHAPEGTMNVREKISVKCPLDLNLFIIPIAAVGRKIFAYIIIGPLLLRERKGKAEYAKDAERLDMDLDELVDALIEINVFSHNKVYSMTQLIERTFSHIAQAGYHKKRLGELAPEILAMDPIFAKYYEERVLNALLSACSLALNADSGSVMTVDKKTKSLHIKVSSKLDDDAKATPDIKIGEGLSGYAVATAQPILLPKDENKDGISEKLKRKYIKSSMIIPFNKSNSDAVCGVINLNMVRKDKDFSEKDIALVKELTNLASIALVPLQPDEDSSRSDA